MIALISGGARGIGLATARAFLERGDSVAILDVEEVDESIRHLEGVLPIRGDVRKEQDCERAVANTVSASGGIDAVVTSAGIVSVVLALDCDAATFADTLTTNVTGSFLVARSAARVMSGGAIIFIGSVYGNGGAPERTAYCGSKGAVHNMTRSLAVEWGERGIRVNCIAPTGTRTPMVQDLIERGIYDLPGVEGRTQLGRLAEPDDIVQAAVFLTSPASSMITGVVLPVDGGWTANGFVQRRRT